jgi:predicted GNAT family acetyltransferase
VRVQRHANAAEFLEHSEAWLLDAEPENNLMFGVAFRSRDAESSDGSRQFWATVYDGDDIVGTSFRTPPWHLAVSDMPSTAITELLELVRDVYPDLSGVNGPVRVAESFARQWTKRCGGTFRTKFRQRIHVLRKVESIAGFPSGALRRMTETDEALIKDWMHGFVRDAGITRPVEGFVNDQLKKRSFYLWNDNGFRCLVSRGRETPNGACITAVYTPPENRCKGYATAAVAALSEAILASGCEFCCLYTDLNNPTSNSIYRKIGFRPIRDDLELDFEPA